MFLTPQIVWRMDGQETNICMFCAPEVVVKRTGNRKKKVILKLSGGEWDQQE